jgi:hypothetical protein
MNADTRDLITWTLGTVLSLSAVLGLLVRYLLLPYLREHLVRPVAQVKKQVTENHHSNAHPTVMDRIDDVHTEVRTLGSLWEAHMEWSDRWTALIQREIDDLRRTGRSS